MSLTNQKKFYEISSYEFVDNGFAVTLDGKSISTQAGMPFILPSESLAAAVAKEWEIQSINIQPNTMPLTALCYTTLDIVSVQRKKIIEQLLQYAETDLLCYRSDNSKELHEFQNTYWQPLLNWVHETYSAQLRITKGIIPIKQPHKTITKLRHVIEDLNDFQLTTLTSITKISGSFIIGLCVIGEHISADDAFFASQLDEVWQRKKWGEDTEDMKRSDFLHTELLEAVRFLGLVRCN